MTDASGIVLAGGRSSRMGRPKALLPFDGEPLIVHVVAVLRKLFADVVVVAASDQDLPAMPVTLVRDEIAYQGPVGGICYGLRAVRSRAAFVTSCDSVFLDRTLISRLVSRIGSHDIVVPYWQGRFQPLHAVYRTALVPLLEAQIATGQLRPVFLFDKVRTLRVDEPEIREVDAEGWSFFNMNTPADYEQAVARWNEMHTGLKPCATPDVALETTAPLKPCATGDVAPQTDVAQDFSPAHARIGAEVHCTVELFGVARLLARMREVSLALPSGATLSQAFAVLARTVPALAGRIVAPDGSRLLEGSACNLNGLNFVRDAARIVLNSGDRLVIVSADAGG